MEIDFMMATSAIMAIPKILFFNGTYTMQNGSPSYKFGIRPNNRASKKE
jgi:hypothetical protein